MHKWRYIVAGETMILACRVSDFDVSNRKRLQVNGRDIFIVKVGGQLYALDSFCYHAGGPLYNGDIEDFVGRTCLVCPWHKYKVCVDSGQNFYQSVDPHNLEVPPKWTAGDVRQRTYKVSVIGDNIFVKFSDKDRTVDSDRYNDRPKETEGPS